MENKRSRNRHYSRLHLVLLSSVLLVIAGCGESAEDNTNSGPASATLTWKSPTRNADDSRLDDLAGYKISYGQSSGSYPNTINLPLSSPDISCQDTTEVDPDYGDYIQRCTYTTDVLSSGTWYFSIQAYDLDGNESSYSSQGIKTI